MQKKIENLEYGNAKILVEFVNNTLVLKMIGIINFKNSHEIINTYFKEIHEIVTERCIREIVINISELEFMNSAGICSIIDWGILINSLPNSKKYFVNIIYNSDITWQMTFIEPLKNIVPDIISACEDI